MKLASTRLIDQPHSPLVAVTLPDCHSPSLPKAVCALLTLEHMVNGKTKSHTPGL